MAQAISITRALATLKSLDSKIEKATANLQLVALQKGTNSMALIEGSQLSPEAFADKIKADFQSVRDMIDQRNKIKRAVIKANAATEVSIGARTMTIAEAIEMKRSIVLESQLLSQVRRTSTAANLLLNKASTAFNTKLDKTVADYTSGREKKLNQEDLDLILNPIKAKETPALVDPLKVSELSAKMEQELDDFLLNVDFALSEVNAKTLVSVE